MAEKKQQSGSLKAASSLNAGDSSEKIYDEWAAQYDNDLSDEWGYTAPAMAADALLRHCPDTDSVIIDWGCGTGLVGEQLHSRGYQTIDGADISEQMLAKAETKNCYRNLRKADLTKPLDFPENSYDAGLCIGSMGAGHIGAEHLPGMLKPVKLGGLLVIYMNEGFYQADTFRQKFERHAETGIWQIVETGVSNYMDTLERPGRLIVGKKTGTDKA